MSKWIYQEKNIKEKDTKILISYYNNVDIVKHNKMFRRYGNG